MPGPQLNDVEIQYVQQLVSTAITASGNTAIDNPDKVTALIEAVGKAFAQLKT